jgi:predicted metal-dependent HD superfamily phosphohydrolase
VVSAELRRRWHQMMPEQPDLGERLLAAWSEPVRVYHDPHHLLACLDAWFFLGGRSRAEALALWFHDVVHHHQPGADERASAAFAAEQLPQAGVAEAEVAEVVRLVLVTIDHRPDPHDEPAARICDADLAILGAPAHTYLASVNDLRAEYREFSASEWTSFRRGQVDALLAREPLFATTTGTRLWAASARANLRAERDAYSSNGLGSPAP